MELNAGTRVLITNYKSCYNGKYAGCTGVIHHVYNGSYAVILDGLLNNRSRFGYYYFTKGALQQNNEGDITMEKITGNYKVAMVQFINSAKQIECACYDEAIECDDYVLVATDVHGWGVATVLGLRDKTLNDNGNIKREVICKLNVTDYHKRIEDRRKRAAIMAKMQERAKKLQEFEIFNILAKTDEDMAHMLEEFKSLEG